MEVRITFSACFTFQLTVCCPKLGGSPDVANRTVHYFCGLMKQATFSVCLQGDRWFNLAKVELLG
jgi:hypothetical protein